MNLNNDAIRNIIEYSIQYRQMMSRKHNPLKNRYYNELTEETKEIEHNGVKIQTGNNKYINKMINDINLNVIEDTIFFSHEFKTVNTNNLDNVNEIGEFDKNIYNHYHFSDRMLRFNKTLVSKRFEMIHNRTMQKSDIDDIFLKKIINMELLSLYSHSFFEVFIDNRKVPNHDVKIYITENGSDIFIPVEYFSSYNNTSNDKVSVKSSEDPISKIKLTLYYRNDSNINKDSNNLIHESLYISYSNKGKFNDNRLTISNISNSNGLNNYLIKFITDLGITDGMSISKLLTANNVFNLISNDPDTIFDRFIIKPRLYIDGYELFSFLQSVDPYSDNGTMTSNSIDYDSTNNFLSYKLNIKKDLSAYSDKNIELIIDTKNIDNYIDKIDNGKNVKDYNLIITSGDFTYDKNGLKYDIKDRLNDFNKRENYLKHSSNYSIKVKKDNNNSEIKKLSNINLDDYNEKNRTYFNTPYSIESIQMYKDGLLLDKEDIKTYGRNHFYCNIDQTLTSDSYISSFIFNDSIIGSNFYNGNLENEETSEKLKDNNSYFYQFFGKNVIEKIINKTFSDNDHMMYKKFKEIISNLDIKNSIFNTVLKNDNPFESETIEEMWSKVSNSYKYFKVDKSKTDTPSLTNIDSSDSIYKSLVNHTDIKKMIWLSTNFGSNIYRELLNQYKKKPILKLSIDPNGTNDDLKIDMTRNGVNLLKDVNNNNDYVHIVTIEGKSNSAHIDYIINSDNNSITIKQSILMKFFSLDSLLYNDGENYTINIYRFEKEYTHSDINVTRNKKNKSFGKNLTYFKGSDSSIVTSDGIKLNPNDYDYSDKKTISFFVKKIDTTNLNDNNFLSSAKSPKITNNSFSNLTFTKSDKNTFNIRAELYNDNWYKITTSPKITKKQNDLIYNDNNNLISNISDSKISKDYLFCIYNEAFSYSNFNIEFKNVNNITNNNSKYQISIETYYFTIKEISDLIIVEKVNNGWKVLEHDSITIKTVNKKTYYEFEFDTNISSKELIVYNKNFVLTIDSNFIEAKSKIDSNITLINHKGLPIIPRGSIYVYKYGIRIWNKLDYSFREIKDNVHENRIETYIKYNRDFFDNSSVFKIVISNIRNKTLMGWNGKSGTNNEYGLIFLNDLDKKLYNDLNRLPFGEYLNVFTSRFQNNNNFIFKLSDNLIYIPRSLKPYENINIETFFEEDINLGSELGDFIDHMSKVYFSEKIGGNDLFVYLSNIFESVKYEKTKLSPTNSVNNIISNKSKYEPSDAQNYKYGFDNFCSEVLKNNTLIEETRIYLLIDLFFQMIKKNDLQYILSLNALDNFSKDDLDNKVKITSNFNSIHFNLNVVGNLTEDIVLDPNRNLSSEFERGLIINEIIKYTEDLEDASDPNSRFLKRFRPSEFYMKIFGQKKFIRRLNTGSKKIGGNNLHLGPNIIIGRKGAI